MFAVIWYVTEMDIRSTLANVCRKVTRDRGQSTDEILLQRCQALKLLGEYFLARGGSAETGLNDLKSRLKHHQHAQEESAHPAPAANDPTTPAPATAPAENEPAIVIPSPPQVYDSVHSDAPESNELKGSSSNTEVSAPPQESSDLD